MTGGRHARERLTLEHPPEVQPENWATFVELKPFEKGWKKLGLDDEDRKALQMLIMIKPDAPVVPGTGGLRKLRFSSNRWDVGKRKGVRVCYAYFCEYSVVLLVTVFPKGRKEDLTSSEKKTIKKYLDEFKTLLANGTINVKEQRRADSR